MEMTFRTWCRVKKSKKKKTEGKPEGGRGLDGAARSSRRGTHTRKGSLGSEVSVILKVTFDMAPGGMTRPRCSKRINERRSSSRF